MVYNLMPRRYREKVKEWLTFSGSTKSPRSFVNYTFSFSLSISFLAIIFIGMFSELAVPVFLLLWLSIFIMLFALFHGFLVLIIDRRAKTVENILPDALQLMAANSRAGYIPSKALIMSARPEFGPLADAIKMAGKEMMTGQPLEESLRHIHKYIRSEMLERTMKMIREGIVSGGHFASLLEENADDIRRIQAIEKEMRANILMYIVFITFAGAICAPVLYALSSFLIATIGSFGGMASMPETVMQDIPFLQFSGVEISQEFLFLFSMAAILITTVFSGLIIGLISMGKEKAGIKYIPIMVILALLVYFVMGGVIASMFGSLIMG